MLVWGCKLHLKSRLLFFTDVGVTLMCYAILLEIVIIMPGDAHSPCPKADLFRGRCQDGSKTYKHLELELYL